MSLIFIFGAINIKIIVIAPNKRDKVLLGLFFDAPKSIATLSLTFAL